MRIQIDTQKKTIKVLDSVRIGELFTVLRKLLGDEYKNYVFEVVYDDFHIIWQYPTVLRWDKPNEWPYIKLDTSITSSTYSIEVQDITEPTKN